MNYYEHHLGDWAAATGHLTWDEDMAYTRLLRSYYHTERAIPEGQQYRLAQAKTPAQRRAVDAVIAEFFTLVEGHFRQKRADTEIARYQDKQAKAKRSADARWNKPTGQVDADADAMRTHVRGEVSDASAERKDSKPYKSAQPDDRDRKELKSLICNDSSDANALRTHCEGNALQTPDTRHQKEIQGDISPPPPVAARTRASTPPRPDDVDAQVWADWLALRRGKRAPVTLTVLQEAHGEAAKAGMSLEAFLRAWCARGSQGLQAGWLKPRERGTGQPAEPAWVAEKRERMAEFAGPFAAKPRRVAPPATDPWETVDGAARIVG